MTGMNGGAGGRGIAGTFPHRARDASVRVAMIGLLGGSVAWVLASCGRDEGQAGPPSAAVASNEAKPGAGEEVDTATSAYSEEDWAACEELTRRLKDVVAAGDPAGVDELVDFDGFLDLVFEDVGSKEPEARALRAGAKAGATERFGRRWVVEGAKVLRLREVDGRPAVLVRVIGEDSRTYLDLEPHRMEDGSFRFRDAFNHAIGERESAFARRILLPHLGELGRSALQESTTAKDPLVKQLDAAEAFLREAKQGDSADAIRHYEALPAELRERKEFLLAYMGCLSIEDPVETVKYDEAVERYMRLYAADPSANLMAIELYSLRGNHEQALTSVAKLTKAFGEDAHLASLAAALYSEMGRHSEACVAAERAVELEPDFEDGWFSLADVSVAAGDYARAVEALDVLEGEEFGYDLSGLAVVSEFEEFMATEEGKEWWKSRERMNPEEMLPE